MRTDFFLNDSVRIINRRSSLYGKIGIIVGNNSEDHYSVVLMGPSESPMYFHEDELEAVESPDEAA